MQTTTCLPDVRLPVFAPIPPIPPDSANATDSAESVAERTREDLRREGVLAVRLVGPPGAGKTSLVEETAWRLGHWARVAVLVANPAARRDAEQMARHGARVEAIDAAVPTADAVRAALGRLDLPRTDLVLIEACGGIAPFPDVGQDATVAVLSVCGGDDKAAEYAHLVGAASAVVLTKTDLRPMVRFDADAFLGDVRRLNPRADLLEVSVADDTGVADWLAWVEARRVAKNDRRRPRECQCAPEWYFG